MASTNGGATTVRVAGTNTAVETGTASGISAVAGVSATAGTTAAAAGVTAVAVAATVAEVSTVAEVNSATDAGETADGIANTALGASTVSCGSTAAGAAGTVVESKLLLVVLDPYHSSANVHDFITNLLSVWSIFIVVLQGFHNNPLQNHGRLSMAQERNTDTTIQLCHRKPKAKFAHTMKIYKGTVNCFAFNHDEISF